MAVNSARYIGKNFLCLHYNGFCVIIIRTCHITKEVDILKFRSLAALLICSLTALCSCGSTIPNSNAVIPEITASGTTVTSTGTAITRNTTTVGGTGKTSAKPTSSANTVITTSASSKEHGIVRDPVESAAKLTGSAISQTAVQTAPPKVIQEKKELHIDSPSCRAAAFYSVDEQKLLYSDNINEKTAPASITKLLTAATALKVISPDTPCTVGSEIGLVNYDSSLAYISPGQEITLYGLITGMLLASGNDAAYTIAVTAARAASPDKELTDQEAADKFCGMMNDLAGEIGMKNSRFVNPDGWDESKQYTTVADIIKLSEYALSVPEIRKTSSCHEKTVTYLSGGTSTWKNSNYLLDPESEFYCKYAVGLKTGTTLNAGNCLSAAFQKDGKTYISVVVGCDTDEDRFVLSKKLFESIVK